jgi:PAS domain S-box-containing protein
MAEQLLDDANDAIVVVDQTATITVWNKAAERLLGHPASVAVGGTLALVIPEQHRARHMAGFHAAIESGQLAHSGRPARIEATTADGATIPLVMTVGLVTNDGGERTGVIAVLRPEAVADSFI